MLACVLLAVRPRLSVAQRFWYFIVFLAVALTLVVEIVVLKGDISRMNTTFKFYLQVWILLGISAAVALGWLADRLQHWRGWGAWVWKGFMGVLVAASFFYVLTATPNKMSDRWTQPQGPGLNGNDYMRVAEYGIPPYKLKWDYEAIQWLQDNVQGHARRRRGGFRSVECAAVSVGFAYLDQHRAAHHHRLGLAPEAAAIDHAGLGDRSTLAGRGVVVSDGRIRSVAQDVLKRYNVKYIVVGALERATYADPERLSPRKFDQMVADGSLRVAYQNEGTTIYEVVR